MGWKFRCGDVVMHKGLRHGCKPTLNEDPGTWFQVKPYKLVVIARCCEECHGGRSAYYMVRTVTQTGISVELVKCYELELAACLGEENKVGLADDAIDFDGAAFQFQVGDIVRSKGMGVAHLPVGRFVIVNRILEDLNGVMQKHYAGRLVLGGGDVAASLGMYNETELEPLPADSK